MRTLLASFLVLLLCTMVVADPEKAKSLEGKPAPDLSLTVTDQIAKVLPGKKAGDTITLKDLKGKNVVIYFYPKAMTPGCTTESCGFRDQSEALAKLDTVVIGISTDKLDDQTKFTEKEKLNFPLVADPDKKATEAFGALSGARAARFTYIIDKDGIVRKVYTSVDVNKHPQEVVMYIKDNLAK
jgi:thioredoxin-dependent peroxiredoxin